MTIILLCPRLMIWVATGFRRSPSPEPARRPPKANVKLISTADGYSVQLQRTATAYSYSIQLQRTDLGTVREPYKWPVLEQLSKNAIRQSLDDSCISAVAEMLSEGRLPEKELIEKLGTPANIVRLPDVLGSEWTTRADPGL